MHSKALDCWRQLPIGQRVRLNGKYRKGELGHVEERLDNKIDGLARYGVRLNDCNRIADLCRYEIKPEKKPSATLFS